jgi:type III secretion protein F
MSEILTNGVAKTADELKKEKLDGLQERATQYAADWNSVNTGGTLGDKGFLEALSDVFNRNVVIKKDTLDEALEAISGDASNPELLAKYQAALAEYTLYRNAQSNAVKAYKDVDANTIRNFN